MEQHVVVFVTVPSPEVGKQIADALLEQKLAACVNILPSLRSLYIWQGKVCDDEEALLMIKTRADLFATRLVAAVKAIHPYEVAEIIALPIVMGSPDYLEWLDEVVQLSLKSSA